MGLLSDSAIIDRINRPDDDPNRLRISAFQAALVKPEGKPSWGLSAFGYDCRLAGEFMYVDPVALAQQEQQGYLEPGSPAPWVTVTKPHFILPSGGFVLARTEEYIRMPRDCGAAVFGKSTWARLAVCLNTTLLEPEWEGTVTLEISNIGPFPVKLTAGYGICQVVFSVGEVGFPVRTSYADRASKTYQGQRAVTLSRV